MNGRRRIVTRSPEQTRKLAARLAAIVKPGDMVLLAGDLGAGKTTFAQGFGSGLGVVEHLTSPTFTLMRPYRCEGGGHSGVTTLVHADLYRLDNLAEVVDLGLGELVDDGAVALVEWGDLAEPVLGPEVLVVELVRGDLADEREVNFETRGAEWSSRHGAIDEALEPFAQRDVRGNPDQ